MFPAAWIAVILVFFAARSSYLTGLWREAVSPLSAMVLRDPILETHTMNFERLYREICDRPFAASDIGWHCTIAERGTDPESMFVEPLYHFHPTDSRVAFLGFINDVVVVHRLWWSEANNIRLLDEFARHLVKPGHGQPYPPPINRDVTFAMLPGPVGEVGGRAFDWIWIAVFLDWIAEQDFGFNGLSRSAEVAPNEQGVWDVVAGGRKTLFTERMFQVLSEIDFWAMIEKPAEALERDRAESQTGEVDTDLKNYSDPMRVAKIARRFGVVPSTIHRWLQKAGKLRVVPAGTLGYRVHLDDLKKYGKK